MYGGDADPNQFNVFFQKFFAGDGEDQMYMGDYWENNFAYGQDGDDTAYLPQYAGNLKYYGGNGADISIPVPL